MGMLKPGLCGVDPKTLLLFHNTFSGSQL